MISNFIEAEQLKWSPRKNGVVAKSGRDLDFFELFSKYQKLSPDPAVDITGFKESVEQLLRPAPTEEFDPMFETCESVEHLIQQAMDLHDMEISPKGDRIYFKSNHDTIKLEDFINNVLCHRDEYAQDSRTPDGKNFRYVYGVDVVRRALDRLVFTREETFRRELRNKLMFQGDGFADYTHNVLTHLLKAAKVPDDELEISVVMVKQWMWQVKSFLNNKAVPDPIFINIQSAVQGGGKTSFVRRISEPFKEFTDPDAKLLHALDERERGRFTSNYIVFFDELVIGNNQGEYGQAIASFKHLLTATTLNPRTMYTTKQTKMDRRYSGIGTSNPPMIDTIYDETGMRRFFEIHFNIKGTSIYPDLRKIDPVALWQGVNENLEGGYIPTGSDNFKRLREIQDGYKRADLIDIAMEHGDIDTIPLSVHDEKFKGIVEVVNGKEKIKAEDLEAKFGIELVPVHRFRKEIVDWIGDNIERAATKYVKGVNTFPTTLLEKGFAVIKFHKAYKVVCEDSTPAQMTSTLPLPSFEQTQQSP